MFDPECQNIECPQCFLGKIYFDRQIGYYCMYCGQPFRAAEMEILVKKSALMSRSVHKSDDLHKKPALEIHELPPRKTKVVHTGHDAGKS